MRNLSLIAAAMLAALASSVTAQQPSAAQPVFRTSTRLIQVSVVVHDGRHRAIPGLKAEDFQVFEDGKERPVSFFSFSAQRRRTRLHRQRMSSPTACRAHRTAASSPLFTTS